MLIGSMVFKNQLCFLNYLQANIIEKKVVNAVPAFQSTYSICLVNQKNINSTQKYILLLLSCQSNS